MHTYEKKRICGKERICDYNHSFINAHKKNNLKYNDITIIQQSFKPSLKRVDWYGNGDVREETFYKSTYQ